MKLIISLFGFIFFVFYAQGQTTIDGGKVSGTWSAEGSPYLINGDIIVRPDEKLTIEPGTNVVFQGLYSFEIQGRIDASGTINDSIIFTVKDSSGYFSNTHQGWAGIYFNGSTQCPSEYSYIKYCLIEYSKYNGLGCNNFPKLEIFNSTIQKNKGTGVYLFSSSDIIMDDVKISQNGNNGISAYYSSPAISDFIIDHNQGSGIEITGSSYNPVNPTLINGLIEYNNSSYTGGGINIVEESYPIIENLIISNNSALHGGGIHYYMSGGTLKYTSVLNNVADNGAGISCDFWSMLTTDHLLVAGNIAEYAGGGIHINNSGLEMINATLSDNEAGQNGGGIFHEGFSDGYCIVKNSILWNNEPDEIYSNDEYPEISYSDIEGGYAGKNNINEDPGFSDPLNDNFYLNWLKFPYVDDSKSPCIDAGDPESLPDPDGTIADMGAFYFSQDYTTSVKRKPSGKIVMYPNPVQNTLNISYGKYFSRIVVMNLNGQLVMDKDSGSDVIQLEVSNLKPGVYIINLFDETTLQTSEKFIKK